MAAGIAFDATQKSSSTITPGNTYTLALTVSAAAGQERLVFLAAVGDTASSDFSACTIDGQTGSRVGSKVTGASGDPAIITAYRAAGTASTSINVVATVGGAQTFSCVCSCYKLTGAGTLSTSSSSITINPTLSVNTVTGGVAAAGVECYNSTAPGTSVWTGLTEDYDTIQAFGAGQDLFTGASLAIVSGSTPLAITVTTTGAPSTSSAGLCLSFDPAAAAGGTTKQMHHRQQMAAA
jgi:hypothetical protein